MTTANSLFRHRYAIMLAAIQLWLHWLLAWTVPPPAHPDQALPPEFTPPYYPPSTASSLDLEWALNGEGPPGIFSSSETPDERYGEYNFCQMPHVRRQEYRIPPPEHKLRYVEVIQRHNKRTPYAANTFFREDVRWDCTGVGPYAHAKPGRGSETTPIYWQSMRDTVNPFEATVGPGFGGSTCQFPSITKEGLSDSEQHGVDFGQVYGDLLDFLPASERLDLYAWRVTNNPITSHTLSAFARGLYPQVAEYSAMLQPASFDSLEPSFRCPLASKIQNQLEAKDTVWASHLVRTKGLRQRFNAVSGIEEKDHAGWASSWDHPFDNLQAKQCHQKALPCSCNQTDLCLTQRDADTIYRLGNWEYAYRWRGSQRALMLSVLKMAPWFQELRAHIRASLSGVSSTRYFHNFAHDGSTAAVLGILQAHYPIWPGMASEIVFELWQKGDGNYVRVLFSGQPLITSTPLGVLDMIRYEDFEEYLDIVLPKDIVNLCSQIWTPLHQ